MNESKTPLSGALVTILFFGFAIVLGVYMVQALNHGASIARFIP